MEILRYEPDDLCLWTTQKIARRAEENSRLGGERFWSEPLTSCLWLLEEFFLWFLMSLTMSESWSRFLSFSFGFRLRFRFSLSCYWTFLFHWWVGVFYFSFLALWELWGYGHKHKSSSYQSPLYKNIHLLLLLLWTRPQISILYMSKNVAPSVSSESSCWLLLIRDSHPLISLDLLPRNSEASDCADFSE